MRHIPITVESADRLAADVDLGFHKISAATLVQVQIPAPTPDFGDQKPEGVSLCMIVRDEEDCIRECLESVRGLVDEVCIVDTGSVDGTLAVIEECRPWFEAIKIEHRSWTDDFSAPRNQSLRMATKRWIFALDADERLNSESRNGLLSIRCVPASKILLHVRIHNAVEGVESSKAVLSHSLPRLFPNHADLRYEGRIHERLIAEGIGWTTTGTPMRIQHGGYEGARVARKRLRNEPLILAAVEENPTDSFARFNAGNHMLAAGKMLEGIEHMREMRRLEEGQEPRIFVPTGYVTLAAALANQGMFEEAHEVANLVLKIAPRYVLAYFVKGEIYAAEKDRENAREWFIKAVDIGQHEDLYLVVDDEIAKWKAQYNIGILFAQDRNYTDAIAWLERAFEAQPAVMLIRGDLLRAFFAQIVKSIHLSECQEAIQLCEKATKHFQETIAPLEFARALAHFHDGERETALEILYGGVSTGKQDPVTRDFMIATLCYRMERYEDARKLLKGANYPQAKAMLEVISAGGTTYNRPLPPELCSDTTVALRVLTNDKSILPIHDVADAKGVRRSMWRMADAAALTVYFSGNEEAQRWTQRFDAGADILTALLFNREEQARKMVDEVFDMQANATP